MALGTPINNPLISISGAFGDIELRGQNRPLSGTMRGVDFRSNGYLNVECNQHLDNDVHYTNLDGITEKWTDDSLSGPVFFEDTMYHIYVGGNEFTPELIQRDPLIFKSITTHPKQKVLSGTINFYRQVGRSHLTFRFGSLSMQITIEVVPTKLDYSRDHKQLISDVETVCHGLSFAYLRATYHGASHSYETSTTLDWIATLRQEISSLKQAIEQITRNPQRHLVRERKTIAAHHVRHADHSVIRAVQRCRGSGEFHDLGDFAKVRSSITAEVRVASIDVPEHIWLAQQLQAIWLKLQTLIQKTRKALQRYEQNNTPLREEARLNELIFLQKKLGNIQKTKVLQHSNRTPQPSPPSLTLLSAPGYREANRIITLLRRALDIQGRAFELELKDIHELYEVWCFLKIIKLVSELTQTNLETSSMIQLHRGGLKIEVKKGLQSDINFSSANRRISISYNRTYKGLTGNHKPDIIITIQDETEPELIIVLDAKYRVDASDSFKKNHGAAGPPVNAINELHRYRDAIVVKSKSELARPVVRGAALFPLTTEETDSYERDSDFFRSLSELGIGALPFLPENTQLVESWLSDLFSLSTTDLAWNGPMGPSPVDRN